MIIQMYTRMYYYISSVNLISYNFCVTFMLRTEVDGCRGGKPDSNETLKKLNNHVFLLIINLIDVLDESFKLYFKFFLSI